MTQLSKITLGEGKTSNWLAKLAPLEGAYSEATLRAYRADIKVFLVWCEHNNSRPFPARSNTLANFITHEAQRCAVSTIKRRVAAIGKIHRQLKFKNPANDEEVKLALRRAMRSKQSRPKQALGLTSQLRDKLIRECPETLIGVRNKAIIAVGYDILARRSELTALLIEDISKSEHGISKIIIRRSKNDPFGYGRSAYLSKRTVEKLDKWIQLAKIENGPIFRAIKNGKISKQSMHPYSVNRIIKATASNAGLPEDIIRNLSGHSMRIGAAQDMMTSGMNILPIMSAGGWKTPNTVARYVENTDLSKLLNDFFSLSPYTNKSDNACS